MPQNIDFEKINFVKKKYVHKLEEDNVHIYNLHRIVPRIISSDIFENQLLVGLSNDDKEFLSSNYTKRAIDQTNELYYVLKNLPLKITYKDMDEFFRETISDKQMEFLLKFYQKNEAEGFYKLTGTFSQLEELQVSKLLQTHFLLINDLERSRIGDLLETCKEVEKEDIFYANMHVDPQHDYFFEHKLDHLPGMMCVETARQFFMACAHIYGNVPLDGVFFTLDNMNINFTEYLWMSYPIRVELRMKETTFTEKGFWHKCSCSVIFFQEFREKARIEVHGMTVPMDTLEKVIINKQVEAALEFNRLPGINSEVYLNDIKNNFTFIGSILDISPKHLMVEFFEDVDLTKSEEFDFRLNLEKHFYTYGVCILRSLKTKNSRSIASFLITHIDSANNENLNEIIKRLCHIREIRGIM